MRSIQLLGRCTKAKNLLPLNSPLEHLPGMHNPKNLYLKRWQSPIAMVNKLQKVLITMLLINSIIPKARSGK